MQNWREWLALASDSWGVMTAVGALGMWLLIKVQGWWQRRQRLKALSQVAPESAVALCVRVGGRSDPVPDVVAYLKERQPHIKQVFVYQAPENATLGNPQIAERIVEDLREAMAALGKQRLTEIHLFPAGMIAYPFILGALLSNWAPVTVYHLQETQYVPLYRLSKEWLQRKQRTTRALAKFELICLDSQAPQNAPSKTGS
ncbi:MAG: SAVED domain-containing protein [Fimbriimonadales bacterium]|nr:SAVED domain-containing protein [Fimbriimonadales bacterium]